MLNDQLRRDSIGGRVVIAGSLGSMGREVIFRVVTAVREFESFTDTNDPHGEHDCAVLVVNDLVVLWKIDYYDETLDAHSPDPSDPDVTVRVMTIMLAEDY
jgi:hypothetical protein